MSSGVDYSCAYIHKTVYQSQKVCIGIQANNSRFFYANKTLPAT